MQPRQEFGFCKFSLASYLETCFTLILNGVKPDWRPTKEGLYGGEGGEGGVPLTVDG